MIVLVILGGVLVVNFVVNWAKSNATMDPNQTDASRAAALSLGGLVLFSTIATVGVLFSPT